MCCLVDQVPNFLCHAVHVYGRVCDTEYQTPLYNCTQITKHLWVVLIGLDIKGAQLSPLPHVTFSLGKTDFISLMLLL